MARVYKPKNRTKPPHQAKVRVKPRPDCRYDPDAHPEQIKYLCMLGATNKICAEFIGITERHFETWMTRYPALKKAVHEGRIVADSKVAHALFRRATGWKQPSVKIMQNQGEPVIVPFTERFPADTAAAKFWLINRHPELWKEHSSQELSGAKGGPITIQLSDSDAQL